MEFKILIGRKFSLMVLSTDLNMGVTSTNFSSFRTIPSAIHEFSIFVKAGAQISKFSLRKPIITLVVDFFSLT